MAPSTSFITVFGFVITSWIAWFSTFTYLNAYIIFFGIAYFFAFRLSLQPPRTTFILTTLALLLRVFCGHFFPEVVPNFYNSESVKYLFDDEVGYMRNGGNVYKALLVGSKSPWNWLLFNNINGVLFYIFGYSIFVIKAFNIMLGVISGFLLARIAEKYYAQPRVTRLVLLVSLFVLPNAIISSIAIKEQLISFCLIFLLYGACMTSWIRWLIIMVSLIVMFYIRQSLALPVVVYLIVYWFRVIKYNQYISMGVIRTLRLVFLFCAVLFIGFAIQSKAVLESKAMVVLSQKGDASAVKMMQHNMKQGAGFGNYIQTDNPFTMKNLLLAPILAFYSPGPFRMFKYNNPNVIFDSLIMLTFTYIATPYFFMAIFLNGTVGLRLSASNLSNTSVAAPGTFSLVKGNVMNHKLAVELYLLVFLLAAYSILTFAPETFRYRWPGLGIYFMLAVYGWCNRHYHPWHKIILAGWWVSVIVYGFVYLR